MKLWRVEHFWTYLSSHLGVIAEYNKGQIISKGLFGILGFFQKKDKRIRFFGLTVLKTNLFVRFLEESEPKSPFEIIWPLLGNSK